MQFSNHYNVRGFKSGIAMSLSNNARLRSPSPANTHLAHIFLMGAKFKMFRIAAERCIALMQHIHRKIKFAVGDQERKAVSLPSSRFVGEAAISFFVNGSMPKPTIVRSKDCHLVPKPPLCFDGGLNALFPFGESNLPGHVTRIIVFSHNSDSLICATLPARQSAGALLLSAISNQNAMFSNRP